VDSETVGSQDTLMSPAFLELREQYERGQLVAFVGAGVSAAAGLPGWSHLVGLLAQAVRQRGAGEAELTEMDQLAARQQYVEAVSAARDILGESEFCTLIERQLDDKLKQVPAVAEAIAALAPKLRAVLTTNLDHLLERAFRGEWPAVVRATGDIATRTKYILKVHGTLFDRSTWVMTREQYDYGMYADPRLNSAFTAIFHTCPLLFIGYGLADDDLDRTLGRIRAFAGNQPPRHFALVDEATLTPRRRKRLESSGITMVAYKNGDGSHAVLVALLRRLADRPESKGSDGMLIQPSVDGQPSTTPTPGLGVGASTSLASPASRPAVEAVRPPTPAAFAPLVAATTGAQPSAANSAVAPTMGDHRGQLDPRGGGSWTSLTVPTTNPTSPQPGLATGGPEALRAPEPPPLERSTGIAQTDTLTQTPASILPTPQTIRPAPTRAQVLVSATAAVVVAVAVAAAVGASRCSRAPIVKEPGGSIRLPGAMTPKGPDTPPGPIQDSEAMLTPGTMGTTTPDAKVASADVGAPPAVSEATTAMSSLPVTPGASDGSFPIKARSHKIKVSPTSLRDSQPMPTTFTSVAPLTEVSVPAFIAQETRYRGNFCQVQENNHNKILLCMRTRQVCDTAVQGIVCKELSSITCFLERLNGYPQTVEYCFPQRADCERERGPVPSYVVEYVKDAAAAAKGFPGFFRSECETLNLPM
jgi:hypothetical protein